MNRTSMTKLFYCLLLTLGVMGLGCNAGSDFDAPAAGEPAAQADDESSAGGEADALVEGLDTEDFTGNVRTYLTDAPAQYDEVWVTITRIEIHQNAGADSKWLTLVDEVQEHDLLTLQNSVTAVLGDANVEPGSYTQLRMIVEKAFVVVDGQQHDLFIPSGQQTGIKINLSFSIEDDKDYILVLDFDASKSIKKTGRGYLMEPVIAVEHVGYLGEDGEVVTVERRGEEDQVGGGENAGQGSAPDDVGPGDNPGDDHIPGDVGSDADGQKGEPADEPGRSDEEADTDESEKGQGSQSDPLVGGMDTAGMSGNVRTYLTDAPGDYDEVWVTISRIEIQTNAGPDSGWNTLIDEAQEHDLLTLQNSVTAVLGDANVAPGSYGQLRMIVEDAFVVVDGVEHELFIPSGAQTGIKINLNFSVEEGLNYVLVLDFDAAKSIKKTGRGYLMEPVIVVEHIGYIGEDGEVVTVQRYNDGAEKDDEEAGENGSGAGEGHIPDNPGSDAGDGHIPEGAGAQGEDGDEDDDSDSDAGEGYIPDNPGSDAGQGSAPEGAGRP